MKLKKLYSTKDFEFYSLNVDGEMSIPLISQEVNAGFPSPAYDFEELPINLNKSLIENPSTTFCLRVNGESMKDVGIFHGDLIIVDRSIEAKNGQIAVCCVDGEFTIKIIKVENQECWLIPANSKFNPIKVTEENELIIWGIVIHAIKSFK